MVCLLRCSDTCCPANFVLHACMVPEYLCGSPGTAQVQRHAPCVKEGRYMDSTRQRVVRIFRPDLPTGVLVKSPMTRPITCHARRGLRSTHPRKFRICCSKCTIRSWRHTIVGLVMMSGLCAPESNTHDLHTHSSNLPCNTSWYQHSQPPCPVLRCNICDAPQ